MKRFFTLLSLMVVTAIAFAQDYIVQTVDATAFSPSSLTIFAGETVEFQNTGGSHNINGTQATYPNNPESFGNSVGTGWSYQYTFNTPGHYDYRCDPHQNSMIASITVLEAPMPVTDLIITGLADPQPNIGSGSKTVELYALNDIPDLSVYGLGVANNGGGSDGVEFTFPAVQITAGTCIMLTDTANLANFETFFGFSPDFLVPGGATSAAGFNGDDAVELFMNGEVVDVFGDINVDGTGTTWEHTDGWVYRVDGTGPDGSTFVESNWIVSEIDALQSDVFSMNAEFANPFPNCTYSPVSSTEILANNDIVNLPFDMVSSIDVLANDQTPNGITSLTVESISINGVAVPNGTTDITYTPNPGFCGMDEVIYEICDANSCSQATVMITINCPTIYPAYDIGLVTADADGNGVGDSLDVNCALTGVVHSIDYRGGNGYSFAIIGSDNEGINVFNFNDVDGYVVTEGDEITVQGPIVHFNGLTEIEAELISINSTGNTLVTPTDVLALGEDTESQLIRMVNMTLVDPGQWLGNGSGFNVDISDGTNTFVMRIDNDTDAASMPVPNGLLNITGIGWQFDSSDPYTEGYQIQPRYMADIEGVVTPEILAVNDIVNLPMDMVSSIDVLANDQLPNGIVSLTVESISLNSIAVPNGTTDITYTPNSGFCGMDEVIYEICDANSCSQATVMITIDCPTLYPAYEIGVVTADSDGNGVGDSLGITCSLTGVVHSIDFRGTGGYSFAIIGSDNEGINVFNFDDVDGYVVTEGDEITVEGEIIQFNGLTEIRPATITVNSTDNSLVTPTDVTSLGEDTESQLIRLGQLETLVMPDPSQWLGDGTSFNVELTDVNGINTYIMRIDDDTDAASMPLPGVLLTVDVTGIGWQFDNMAPYTEGYQIQPRYMSDIIFGIQESVIDPSIADKISIYPNPVNTLLQIDSEIAFDEIRMSNVLGQRVGSWLQPAEQLSIDVADWQRGVYTVTFVSGERIWTTSFVKE